ncbi:hypothetical protein [Methylobacterium komagatae]
MDAVAKGDLSRLSMGAYASLHELKERLVVPDIGSLFAGYVERPLAPGELKDLLTPEDFTGLVTLEPGTEATLPPGTQIHMGHTRGLDVPATSPWILVEVIPGQLTARPVDETGDWHRLIIEASATAVVTREDGSDRRVLKAAGWHKVEGRDFEGDAKDLLDEIMMKANSLAAAFIKASTPAVTEEAA